MSVRVGDRGRQRVQRDYGGVGKQLRTIRPLSFDISETVIPVYDISGVAGVDQLTLTTTTIVAATGNVVTSITTPVGMDYIYTAISVTLAVARAVIVQVDPPASSPTQIPFYNSQATALVSHPLNSGNAIIPIRIPGLFSLRVVVVSMLVGDGNGTIAVMRTERFRDGN